MVQLWTPTFAFVMIIIIPPISSYLEAYNGELYFTTPGPNVMQTFEDAKSWCAANSSQLAVVKDSHIQMTLTQFLTSSNLDSTMYINIKLSQHGNTWVLISGQNYTGALGNQNDGKYRMYSCLHYTNTFIVEASRPDDLRSYLCDFEYIKCSNNSADNFFYDGKCYVKYENESVTWYEARERCINNGGDLATFNYDPASYSSYTPPFNTSWLNRSLTYWVGIRYKDWSWKYPDGSEAMYTSWSKGKPNMIDYSCVCVDPNGTPAWSWTDCACNMERKFVCLKIVPTTTWTTTTPMTTTMASTTIKFPVTTNATSAYSEPDASKSLAIGLGAGIGGGVLIIFVVVIVIIAVVVIRRKRRGKRNDNSESLSKLENNSKNKEIPKSGERDVYAVANNPSHNQLNRDVYATVVSTTTPKACKNESSPNEIIYSAPDFVQDPSKSTPSNSNYEAASRVKEHEMVSTLRGQTTSMFPQDNSDIYANARNSP